jgi:putative membrane protein
MMGGYGFGMLGFGALVMFVFWALIIAGAVWLVVTIVRGGQGRSLTSAWTGTPGREQTPLEILQTRYAKGDISKQQFDEMKRNLGL